MVSVPLEAVDLLPAQLVLAHQIHAGVHLNTTQHHHTIETGDGTILEVKCAGSSDQLFTWWKVHLGISGHQEPRHHDGGAGEGRHRAQEAADQA